MSDTPTLPKRSHKYLSAMNFYGGKARATIRDFVVSHIPYHKDNIYVEPFAGMLSILLSREPCTKEIVNDNDADIMNWWRVVREQPDGLIFMIDHTPHSKLTFYECVQSVKIGTYNNKPLRLEDGQRNQEIELVWAWVVFVVLQHNVVHSINKFGWGSTLKRTNKRYSTRFTHDLPIISARLEHVQLDCCDATHLLSRTENIRNAVIYCDPPYRSADTTSYKKGKTDWDELTAILLAQKGMVAISGYSDEWDHLSWQRTEHQTRFNHMGEHAKRDSEYRTEVLWTNYDVYKVKSGIQGKLF